MYAILCTSHKDFPVWTYKMADQMEIRSAIRIETSDP